MSDNCIPDKILLAKVLQGRARDERRHRRLAQARPRPRLCEGGGAIQSSPVLVHMKNPYGGRKYRGGMARPPSSTPASASAQAATVQPAGASGGFEDAATAS